EKPLDVLAQQIVAAASAEDWDENKFFELVCSAWSYRNLTHEEFDNVVNMLAEGFSTRRGRRAALIHHDAVNHRVRGRRGARLVALTSGGAIPDNADYRVVLEPGETFLGTVNEDFAVESMAGDIFQLGNASWTIIGISSAHHALGVIPSQDKIVIERFFDESGGMQLVIHAPFGIRLNRGWGLALRKRFCRSFNFELQAAATDDAIVLSLGTQHSFPLEEVFRYLNSQTLRDLLVQA